MVQHERVIIVNTDEVMQSISLVSIVRILHHSVAHNYIMVMY